MWQLIGFTVCVVLLIHWILFGTYGYWKKRNVPFPKPTPFFGNVGETLSVKKHLLIIYQEIYEQFKDYSWVGYFKLRTPAIIIRDVDLVKDVMIKNFSSFHDNDVVVDEKKDPLLGKNPFFLKGQRWKFVRAQVSAAITTGKIKNMFTFINRTCKDMVEYLKNDPERKSKNGINAKELSTKFTTDVVAACAFGLEGNSFVDPDSQFRKMGQKIFQPEGLDAVMSMIAFLFPSVSSFISFSITPKDVKEWFMGVLSEAIKYREENKIVRNDYLDLMLSLKNKPGEFQFTDLDVMAQSMTFYSDGMETSATALSFILYELARHPDIQSKLLEEIESVLSKFNGEICYEAVHEMAYLEMVVTEGLRLYPPIVFLMKVCTKTFTLPSPSKNGPGVEIEPGMSIIIPIYPIHRDSKYYESPEEFIPERFSEENKKNIPKCAYIPFGDGPRQCLGFRFALTQIKAAIVAIVNNFEMTLNSKTAPGFEIDPKVFILDKIGGIWINFNERVK